MKHLTSPVFVSTWSECCDSFCICRAPVHRRQCVGGLSMNGTIDSHLTSSSETPGFRSTEPVTALDLNNLFISVLSSSTGVVWMEANAPLQLRILKPL